jgi:hypothetical protein
MADVSPTAPAAVPAFELTERELKKASKNPRVLRALADMHDCWATEADGMDMADSSKWHTERARALTTEADRIQKEWENG